VPLLHALSSKQSQTTVNAAQSPTSAAKRSPTAEVRHAREVTAIVPGAWCSKMLRATLEERLRIAKAHVALGNMSIHRQRERVSEMEQAGRDTTATKRTKRLLNNVLGLQAMRIAT
jgi:hypothetical protein